MLGFVETHRRELLAARKLLTEARDVMVELDDHWGALFLLECSGVLAVAEGNPVRALRLFGVSSTLRERTGVPLSPAHRESFEPWFLAARTALPAGEAMTAMRSVRTLTLDQSISAEQLRALLAEDTATEDSGRRQPGALSRREREIAGYVARGWTNQATADALIVSRRTVESHLSHILDKLGLTSRAQVAVWAAQHGLFATPLR
jgi:non-specific serine/threonine protein kinase